MDEYLNDEQQENLKGMLYQYLKDKAARRVDATSKSAYEGSEDAFKKQMGLYDVGALASSLSDSASRIGQIQGKRSRSDALPKLNEQLYGSTQNAFRNYNTLRGLEETSNMNDVQVARLISGIEQANDQSKLAKRKQDFDEQQYADTAPVRDLKVKQLQQQLKARKFQPELVSPTGDAVTLDVEGQPSTLEGYEVYHRPVVGGAQSWEIVEGAQAPSGKYLLKSKSTGETKYGELPIGAKLGPSRSGFDSDGKRMSESSTLRVSEARDAFAAADAVTNSVAQYKEMMGPIEGNLRSINPYDADAQKFKATLKRSAQVIAKYMEGGVLRKEDEIKYLEMLPSLGDTAEVAEFKNQQIKKMLQDKQNRDVQALKDQGYNTKGLGIEATPQGASGGSERQRLDDLRQKYRGR